MYAYIDPEDLIYELYDYSYDFTSIKCDNASGKNQFDSDSIFGLKNTLPDDSIRINLHSFIEPANWILFKDVNNLGCEKLAENSTLDKIKIEGGSSNSDGISGVSTSPKNSTKVDSRLGENNNNLFSEHEVNYNTSDRNISNPKSKNSKIKKSKRNCNRARRPKSKFSKKARSRYHYEQNSQDLSKRKDVVNKTLLRSLKRYYTNFFESDITKYLTSQKDEIASYTNHNKRPMSIASVKTLVEIIRAPSNMRPNLKSKYDKQMWDDFHACLYQYSHTKLYMLLNLPQVKFIVKDYIENGIEIMLANDETLKKNPEVYRKACTRFNDIINN